MMQRFSGGTPEGRERVIAQEPIGRMGKPEEIAAAVVWLCSDAASPKRCAFETDLDGIAEAYTAMDERRAIKSLVRVGTM
jgi:NAD(P)-dependent dehydrogenase (short-subunit alcohol dehydrogenase family)